MYSFSVSITDGTGKTPMRSIPEYSRLTPPVPPGGPAPQAGVTITMDDEALNGTNRVVLDGVMTNRECDTIMQLAAVKPRPRGAILLIGSPST